MALTILRLGEAGVPPPPAFMAFLKRDVRGLLLELGQEPPASGQVLELCRQHAIGRLDVLALHTPVAAELAQALCEGLRPALVHAPLLPELADWLQARLYQVTGPRHAWIAEAWPEDEARVRYTALQAAGDLAAAEPIVAALAESRPEALDLQRAALGCNLALGQAGRARGFAIAVLRAAPADPVAHLA